MNVASDFEIGKILSSVSPRRLPVLGSGDEQQPFARQPRRIVIPALQLDTLIVISPRTERSWQVDHLKWQVGYLEDTAYPGEGSNVVLGGHRYLGLSSGEPALPGPFFEIDRLEEGDHLQVYTDKHLYLYQMTVSLQVNPREVWVVKASAGEMLTLLTCDDWNSEGYSFDKRLVIRASLLEVSSVQDDR